MATDLIYPATGALADEDLRYPPESVFPVIGVGPAGPAGPAGAAGVDGLSVLSGAGAPAGVYPVGTTYINVTTGDVWQYV